MRLKEEEEVSIKEEEERIMRVNNVSFNHDSSCVVLATENGFRILKADSGALLHTFGYEVTRREVG